MDGDAARDLGLGLFERETAEWFEGPRRTGARQGPRLRRGVRPAEGLERVEDAAVLGDARIEICFSTSSFAARASRSRRCRTISRRWRGRTSCSSRVPMRGRTCRFIPDVSSGTEAQPKTRWLQPALHVGSDGQLGAGLDVGAGLRFDHRLHVGLNCRQVPKCPLLLAGHRFRRRADPLAPTGKRGGRIASAQHAKSALRREIAPIRASGIDESAVPERS